MTRSIFGLLLLWTTALHATPAYRIYDLPALGGKATTPTAAYGISEGWIAGSSGAGTGERAVRWPVSASGPSAPLNLGVLSGTSASRAYAVSNAGNVAGASGDRAFAWFALPTPTLHPILPPPGQPSTARCFAGYAVNDLGEVVGSFSKVGTTPPHWAFHWKTDLGTTLYSSIYYRWLGTAAYAINMFGHFAGSAERQPVPPQLQWRQAYIWQPDPAEPGYIGAFGGPEGTAGMSVIYGMNDLSQVVGESEGRAFFWQTLEESLTSLGPGAAKDINNMGEIVGYAPGPTDTYAWVGRRDPGAPVTWDLNALIPANSGWTLLQALGINDRGWIVGIGRKKVPTGGLSGEEGEQTIQVVRGFLLIPQ